MRTCRAAAAFLTMVLGAQEPVYFRESEPPWWHPRGELRLEAERLPALDEGDGEAADRLRSLLQLDWSRGWKTWRGELALRAAAGSDGNRLNVFRYDQQPSNGAWLHRALVSRGASGSGGFGNLALGLQGNPLLTAESLWDHDLGILGVGGRVAFRNEERGLLEAGLRGVAGRVRTFPAGHVDLAAVQGVLRFDTESIQWTFHAGRWEFGWDRGEHRLGPLDPGTEGSRIRARFDAAGLGLAGGSVWPWEIKAMVHRNAVDGGTGGEAQVWLGPQQRRYIPRFGFIQQRFSSTGTAPPVNGDEWWFTRAARGPRAVVTVLLPRQVRVTLSHLEHRWDGERRPRRRTNLTVSWHF